MMRMMHGDGQENSEYDIDSRWVMEEWLEWCHPPPPLCKTQYTKYMAWQRAPQADIKKV